VSYSYLVVICTKFWVNRSSGYETCPANGWWRWKTTTTDAAWLYKQVSQKGNKFGQAKPNSMVDYEIGLTIWKEKYIFYFSLFDFITIIKSLERQHQLGLRLVTFPCLMVHSMTNYVTIIKPFTLIYLFYTDCTSMWTKWPVNQWVSKNARRKTVHWLH
jgi:hypothetical protein